MSPPISGTSGTIGIGLNCTDPPAPADELAITAKSADGKSSALGEINLCQLSGNALYNTKPALTLVAGQTSITVTFTAQLINANCSTNIVNPCTPQPIIAGVDNIGGNIGPGTPTLTPQGGSGIPLYFNGDGQAGTKTTATASVPVTATPTTYTLSIPYTDSSGETYSVETGQTSYTLDSSTPMPFDKTVTLIGTPLGVVVVPPSCPSGDEAIVCQGQQIVTCNIVWYNPLSWFVCPAVSSIQDIMNSLGSAITKYLTIPSYYFNAGSTTGKPLYEAWDSVRDIALALLAIITLVMVFSQAVSIGPFDAYTVKKVLPRLIIAAILITLSWPLIGLMIGISNGFGNGIRYLIFAPFRNLPAVSFSAGSEALVGGLGIGAALGLFGTLTLGLMAAVALFTGLIVIVLRQIIVILLAVLSPIALVLYIMPGTEKVWKMWWNSFWGVLIMFPLIEAFIAFGSVFSKITMASGNTGLLDKIIAYIAIYIPYFLLPMTVRFAGGMMQAIGGKVTQISSGAQKGLNKRRKETVIRNKQEGKYGGRFKGTNPVSKGLSSAYGAIFAGPRGWVPGGSGKAVRSQNKLIGDAMYKKENAGWQIGQFDSSAVRLAATGFSADENEQRGKEAYAAGMKDYTASMKALETADTSTPEKAAEVEAKTAAVKALAKKHKDTLDQTLAAIARGKAAGMYTPQGQRAAFERAGLSGGAMFTSQDEARQAARRIAGNDDNVYGNMLGSFEHNATDAGTSYFNSLAKPPRADADEMEWENWNYTGVREHLSAKPEEIQHYVTHFTRQLKSDKPEEVERALVALNEIEQGMNAGVGTDNVNTRKSLSAAAADRTSALTVLRERIEKEPARADNLTADKGTIEIPLSGGKTRTIYEPRKETTEERIRRLTRPVLPPEQKKP
jgi:hypothetical protein